MSAAACDLCALLASPAVPVWRNERLSVVLVDDAACPGFCRVVWNAHVKEMTDLTGGERDEVMSAVWNVELALREVMAPHKINVASLGNMTPHVHWHVIPRFSDDAHFPNPVWVPATRSTDAATLAARKALLPQLQAAIVRRMTTSPAN
jgi:diadenosine tetraphosphate (Ap4A) HIT family hydrolase